jgi:hypothetical protein
MSGLDDLCGECDLSPCVAKYEQFGQEHPPSLHAGHFHSGRDSHSSMFNLYFETKHAVQYFLRQALVGPWVLLVLITAGVLGF